MSRHLSSTVRWVVLYHTGVPEPHFDLMYEDSPGSPLTTWRLPEWPVSQYVRCTQLGAHRREYLEYQGAISRDRGEVRRVAVGTCRVETLSSEGAAHHIELWNSNGEPFVMLECERGRWTAVPLKLQSDPTEE